MAKIGITIVVLLASLIWLDAHFRHLSHVEARSQMLDADMPELISQLDFDGPNIQLASINSHYRLYRSLTFFEREYGSSDRTGRKIAFSFKFFDPRSVRSRLLIPGFDETLELEFPEQAETSARVYADGGFKF